MRLTRRSFARSLGGIILGVPLLTRRVRAEDDEEWVEDLDVEADLEVDETIALGSGDLPEDEDLGVAVSLNLVGLQLASVKDIDPKAWRLGGTDVTKAPPSLSAKIIEKLSTSIVNLLKENGPAVENVKVKIVEAIRASGKTPWKDIQKMTVVATMSGAIAVGGAVRTTPSGLALGTSSAIVGLGLKAYKDARR